MSKFMKLIGPQKGLTQKMLPKIHSKTVENQRQRENFKSIKRKKFLTYKGNLQKAISRFLHRKLTGYDLPDMRKW